MKKLRKILIKWLKIVIQKLALKIKGQYKLRDMLGKE